MNINSFRWKYYEVKDELLESKKSDTALTAVMDDCNFGYSNTPDEIAGKHIHSSPIS